MTCTRWSPGQYLAQYGYSRTKAEQILTLCPTHAAWMTP